MLTGFSTVSRVASLTMRNTVSRGWPSASPLQPVRACATGFSRVIRPCASVTTTASPMLVSVVRKRSRSACSTSAARWRAARLRATSVMTIAMSTSPSPSPTIVLVERGAGVGARGRVSPGEQRALELLHAVDLVADQVHQALALALEEVLAGEHERPALVRLGLEAVDSLPEHRQPLGGELLELEDVRGLRRHCPG